MNSGRVGVLGVVDGKESGKVPGPRKLEPERRARVSVGPGPDVWADSPLLQLLGGGVQLPLETLLPTPLVEATPTSTSTTSPAQAWPQSSTSR